MKPLVSILIPAYNAQEWVADALRSATAQSWKRKEIIVVDDGSTDQTLAVARQFETNGVLVVKQENQGGAAARNKAYSLSQGEYIQWLDADDILSANKIARQMQVLAECGSRRTLASSPWGRFLYRFHRAQFTPTALWCDLSPAEWLVRKLGQNLHMQTATWLVSRQLSEAAGPWDSSLAVDDDGEYFCRVLLASDGVRFVPDAKVYYRASGPGSLSHIGRSERKAASLLKSMELHIGYLRSLEDSNRVRSVCVRYLQNWLLTFYPERPDLVQRAERLAAELGGRLEVPQLSWKYSWIQAVFGWNLAKQARIVLPEVRQSVTRSWDRAMFRIERRSLHEYLAA